MGELSLVRFAKRHGRFTTFLSSGLVICPEQKPSRVGRYELMCVAEDEGWVREVLSDIARMSFDLRFDGGHTFDLSSWAFETDTLQGVLFEEACRVRVDGSPYGVLRCIGITRRELAYARKEGPRRLLVELKANGVYPASDARRRSVVAVGADLPRTPLPSGTAGSVLSHEVAGLDLSIVKGISGHQGVSAVTVLGRDLDETNAEEIWFRLDVRLEDEVGLVQIEVPVRSGEIGSPPVMRIAWHDGIVFPPYDKVLKDGARHPVPDAARLMRGLYRAHLDRG